jgi:hypothetical protein
MNWIDVSSSNLSRVRYEEQTNTLEIEFRGGRIFSRTNKRPLSLRSGLNRST